MNSRVGQILIGLGREIRSAMSNTSNGRENGSSSTYQVQLVTPAPPGARTNGISPRILSLFEKSFCGQPIELLGIVNALCFGPRIYRSNEGFQGWDMTPWSGTG